MVTESTLAAWTGPSSDTEQEKQDRTERMIREAVAAHPAFRECGLSIYAKGSYANNTNVRADSDVDIAVECTDVEYWDESSPGAHPAGSPYEGIWTPQRLRAELTAALSDTFEHDVDTSGSTAIQVHSGTARVDADVVPCFSYAYYLPGSEPRRGTKIFTKSGTGIVNYPAQQLTHGRAKNVRTSYAFKKAVRILKRVENAMVTARVHQGLPSYFIECLGYNCPDTVFGAATWTDIVRNMLVHIWTELDGDEPDDVARRWVEVNECFYLFHDAQKWTRADGRAFAGAAWAHLGYA
jgi:hypothetical protein